MKTYDFTEYTTRPYGGKPCHNEKNGQDFKKILDKFFEEGEPVLIKIPSLDLPFSDSFVYYSFFLKMIEVGSLRFWEIIKIDDNEWGDDLREVMDDLCDRWNVSPRGCGGDLVD